MPAYGFFARNARRLTLRNVHFQFQTPELRSAVILDHVKDVAVNGLSVQPKAGAKSAVCFIEAKQVLLTAPRLLTPGSVFLQLEGAPNEAVVVDGGELSKAAAPVACKNGATDKAAKLRG